MTDTFLNYEPLISSLGVNREGYLSCAKFYCAGAAEKGLSLVARDRKSSEVAGSIICEDLVTEWNKDEDAKRFLTLSKELGRVAPVPSIYIDAKLAFDVTPGSDELKRFLNGLINPDP